MEVVLAYLDALRHRATPTPAGPVAGPSARPAAAPEAGAEGGGGSVGAEQLRAAFAGAAAALEAHAPGFMDRQLRWEGG